MGRVKVSFIATVYNEEKTIDRFLDSLLSQTQLPQEVVIVDAGSTDTTLSRLKIYEVIFKKKQVAVNIIIKKGNRSIGRNEAIRQATGDMIIASDAGCILDKDWVKEITAPFENKKIDVVAGFYHPVAHTVFEKCMAAYTSVMPDRIDPESFLPSSRSIGFKKSVWEKNGKYPEELDTCEDLVFARRLKTQGFQFKFTQKALVYWPQRHNLLAAFAQFYSYAVGDGQAGYIRPQTPFLFIRYLLAIVLIVFTVQTRSGFLLYLLFLGLILYLLWAIRKNYRYVNDWHAFYILPILQFTADFAVIFGFTVGMCKRLMLK